MDFLAAVPRLAIVFALPHSHENALCCGAGVRKIEPHPLPFTSSIYDAPLTPRVNQVLRSEEGTKGRIADASACWIKQHTALHTHRRVGEVARLAIRRPLNLRTLPSSTAVHKNPTILWTNEEGNRALIQVESFRG